MLPMLIAVALAAAAPPPGVSEGVACVIAQTSEEDAAGLGDDVLAGRDVSSGEAANRLTDHLGTCIQRFGWDEAQSLRVSTLTITEMGRRVAVRRLTAAGIEPASLDRWFAAQSEDFRTRAFGQMSEEEAGSVLETLVPNVLSAETFERHSELVGGYLAALALAFRVERGLPLE